MEQINVDIAVIGGGIAGLWVFNELQKQGYHVALLENKQLGTAQTISSQGIVHGGLKYALQGILTPDANAIKQMPALWNDCLQGKGCLDLSDVKIISDGQYLWSTGNIATNISSFFASKALHGKVDVLEKNQYPVVFQSNIFNGKIYKLKETILNIQSLLESLSKPFHNNLIKIDSGNSVEVNCSDNGDIEFLKISIEADKYILKAKQYIFTAGEGNEHLLKNFPSAPKMQRRPLHMVYAKAQHLPSLYGHCIGMSSTPRITITTHMTRDGQTVWYMGGKLAEDGVNRTSLEQIAYAKQEIADLFPWLELNCTWGSFFVDRAEAKQALGLKPETETVFHKNNYIIGWPTKLVLSPMLTNKIINILKNSNIKFSGVGTDLSVLPKPQIAEFPWDKE